MDRKQKALFNEEAADLLVIENLERQINKLRGVSPMSKILVDAEGTLYRAHSFEVITAEELGTTITELEKEQANAVALQAAVATPAAPVEETVAQPEPAVEAEPVAETTVEAPAQNDQPDPVPPATDVTAAPVEEPAVEAAEPVVEAAPVEAADTVTLQ